MNNPLRQYFRRPALHFKLPSQGKYYPPGALEMPETGELPVFPMTAIDEITSKTPDALFNGSAVADIIKSCVPAIKDPWNIPSMDLDALLICIRAATNGNELEISSTCPSCENKGKYGVNLIRLLSTITSDDYNNPLVMGEVSVRFRPLSYKEVNDNNLLQFNLQREITAMQAIEDETARQEKSNEIMKIITKTNMDLITSTIESISVPSEVVTDRDFIHEFLEKCDRNTFESIRLYVSKIRTDATTKPQRIRCVNCSHEYDQELALNVADFFV